MNVKLLRRVAKHILAEPKRLVMDAYFMRKEEEGSKSFANDGGEPLEFAKCGTAACIAGWTCFLSGDTKVPYSHTGTRAEELLSIDGDQGRRLFHVGNWPEVDALAYRAAQTQRTRAEIAARVIEDFIKTGQ